LKFLQKRSQNFVNVIISKNYLFSVQFLALVKVIEIIGEAASRVSPEYQANHPQIPWPAMSGMRNRLVHAYFDINLRILWQTTQEDLPLLIDDLEKLPEIKS
jgi:uncharacterized protein with HEPN domain